MDVHALLADGQIVQIRPDGALAIDARVKVMRREPQDPFLRKLR